MEQCIVYTVKKKLNHVKWGYILILFIKRPLKYIPLYFIRQIHSPKLQGIKS